MPNAAPQPAFKPSAKGQALPHFTGTLAMIWFIAGLGMLFGAMMLGYLAVRMNRADDVQVGTIHLPKALWVSTALVLLASVAVQSAVSAIRRERQDRMRAWLVATLILALLFTLVQIPSLGSLIHQHFTEMAAYQAQLDANPNAATDRALMNADSVHGPKPQPFFGLIFVFILIHAAHVAGGIIQLVVVTRGAFRGNYDHEYYNPVKHAAMYWHFLDVVWLVMYGTIYALG